MIARIALLIALTGATAPSSWAQSDVQRCSGETRQVLAAALQYAVGDVPDDYSAERIDPKSPVIADYGILRRNGKIYIRDSVDNPSCRVDKSVLPRSTHVTFTLVGADQLREVARPYTDGIAYVRAIEMRVSGDEAEILLGVALQLAPGDSRGLTCCCGGRMVLRRVSGKWMFEEWRSVLCA